jgi:hypothetical protein
MRRPETLGPAARPAALALACGAGAGQYHGEPDRAGPENRAHRQVGAPRQSGFPQREGAPPPVRST